MVNHFSTLLINLNLGETTPSVESYFLGTELSELLATENNELFILDDIKTYIKFQRMYNVLINKDYVAINLPQELLNFYNLIFPENSSKYYKQFLLYAYLKIINSTDLADKVALYDNRISYNLEEIDTYFRLNQISVSLATDPLFKLYPSGKYNISEKIQGPVQSFIIKQKENTNRLLVFCITDGNFYKKGVPENNSSLNMESELVYSVDAPKLSTPIAIGDTGLSFTISNSSGLSTLTDSANKLWTFSVDTPLAFDYVNKLTELNNSSFIINEMFNFRKESCDIAYENYWRTHFNNLYKIAGLLVAYVERINLLWQEKVM